MEDEDPIRAMRYQIASGSLRQERIALKTD